MYRLSNISAQPNWRTVTGIKKKRCKLLKYLSHLEAFNQIKVSMVECGFSRVFPTWSRNAENCHYTETVF